MRRRKPFERTGISLVELLVVIAIAATALSLLMPAVLAAQNQATARQTINDLKQIALAMHNTNDVYRKLPPAYGRLGASPAGDQSVFYHLLPFIEQDLLYKAFKADAKVETYCSEEDPSLKDSAGIGNFAANLRIFTDVGVKTAYNKEMSPLKKKEDCAGSARIPATFVDGTSNTIVFTTKFAVCGEGGSKWASSPLDKTAPFFGQNAATEKASPASDKATFQLLPAAKDCLCSPLMAQSFSKRGLAVALGDASTRTIGPALSFETWNRAVQPNDGKVLDKDWEE